MPRTKTPRGNPPSRAAATLLKPILCAGLAVAALATIVWLAGASFSPGNRDFLPGSLVEFMNQAETGGAAPVRHDRPITADEWPAHNITGYDGAGHAVFSPPQARRNLLTRQNKKSVPASRNDEFKQFPGAGRTDPASSAPAQVLPAASPAVTLAVARGMLDAPKTARETGGADAVSEVAGAAVGAVADRTGALTRLFPRGARAGKGTGISSAEALANVPADYQPLSVDDLFSLKLRGEYGTSKANLKNGGVFEDRFLVLGGDKKFEFAGMDQMKLKMDGVLTTGGRWDDASIKQDLSGIALNVGPEVKFPELPIKLNINLGAGWLKRKATLIEDVTDLGPKNSKADIDSFVYGGGAAMHSDWQWRMFKITGMAGVQYATSADKEHTFKFTDQAGVETDYETVEKLTQSAWEVPLQLRIGGEYKLLNALSVLPSLWGGYTFNISGKNGTFRNGHIAGAESTWRRHGLTWNRNSYHIGGELRIRAVDRFDLWFAYQKDWVGEDSGKYMGGGIQIAF